MTIDLRRFDQLKKSVEKAKSDADQAAGALNQIMARLKSEHACDTLEQAEALAARLTTEAATAEAEYNDALANFELEWTGCLQGTG